MDSGRTMGEGVGTDEEDAEDDALIAMMSSYACGLRD